MMLFTLHPPRQWQAGTVGGKPFHFSCGDCGAKDPLVAGVAAAPDFPERGFPAIGLVGELSAMNLRPAMFCAECLAERLAGRPPRAWNPPPPPSWPHLRHHRPTVRCARVRWRMLERNLGNRAWEFPRTWEAHAARLQRLLTRILHRHLAAGRSVIENDRTEWKVGAGQFASGYDRAEHIAAHVANRVTGFGWSIALA